MGKLVQAYLVSATRKDSGNLRLKFSNQASTTVEIEGCTFAQGDGSSLRGYISLQVKPNVYVKADGSNLPEAWRSCFKQTKKGKLVIVDKCIQPILTGKPFSLGGRTFHLDLSKPKQVPKLNKKDKPVVDRRTGRPVMHIPKDPKVFVVTAQ